MDSSPSTEVAEGRYLKGDPLKGYYDFVITEGSYKFWAVFQVRQIKLRLPPPPASLSVCLVGETFVRPQEKCDKTF